MNIGFETHIPLDTKTKLFSDEARGKQSPYAAGEPGTRPVLQRRAVKQGIRLALTLDMDVANTLCFDRKQYFYPDLPKGYQITQHRKPLAENGVFSTTHGDVHIKELHLEEDPSSTEERPRHALIDDARSGEALIELVTTPCMQSIDEAISFLEELSTHAEYLGIIDTTKGFKTDLNVSIDATSGTRVEVKNVTGQDNVKDALQYEAWRHRSAAETGNDVKRETRHYDDEKTMTTPSRSKETYTEYAFIPEPDIPATPTESLVQTVKADLPKPRQAIIDELVDEGVSKQEATTIASHPEKRGLYEAIEEDIGATTAQTVITQHLPHILDAHDKDWSNIPQDSLNDAVRVAANRDLPGNTVKDVLWNTLFDNADPDAWLDQHTSDASLQAAVRSAVDKHPDRVQAYKDGEKAVINAFMGDVAQARPDADKQRLRALIEERLEEA